MATLTDKSKVSNAIRLYNEAQSMYLVLGGKNTEWPNPAVPTVPQSTTTTVPELIGLKRVSTVSLARPTNITTGANIVSSGGQNYELVSLANAYAYNATYVYIATDIGQDDFPDKVHRIIALTSNPTFTAGVTSAVVPYNYVTNQGTLQAIENVTATDMTGMDMTEFILISA